MSYLTCCCHPGFGGSDFKIKRDSIIMCTTRKKRVQFKNKLQLKHRKFLGNLCSNRRYFCNGTFFCSFARRCYFDSKINPINLNCPKQKRSFAHLLTMHRVARQRDSCKVVHWFCNKYFRAYSPKVELFFVRIGCLWDHRIWYYSDISGKGWICHLIQISLTISTRICIRVKMR